MSTPEIVAKECRFALHIPAKAGVSEDMHLVKECLHYQDGTTAPNIRFVKNYQRDFYVSLPTARNYQQKRECESMENLRRYSCTQSDLRRSVAKALGKAWSNADMRILAESPYLYGSDISSTSLIKEMYRRKYPDAISPYSVAFFDIETDVLHETNDPVLVTTVFKNKILTVVDRAFIQGYPEPELQFRSRLSKYLQPYLDKYQFEVQFEIVDGPVALIKRSLEQIHAWSPDFLAIWNLDFDIPRILETLEKYNVDPKDVFSDPKLPPEYRFCKYKKGSTKKVTASGQVKPKNPSEQWHSLYCPAGFYVIDAMCTFRFVRQGEQERPSYSLDAILETELGIRKLNFEEAQGYVKLEWHQFMQSRYPFEYAVYNVFDCVGMLELETKTNDLSMSLITQAGFTDFARYNSQTKRFADSYHFFLLERNLVIGTIPPKKNVSAEEADDVDLDEAPSEDSDDNESEDEEAPLTTKSSVLSLRQWIVTLPAHLSSLGLQCIEENPALRTMVRAMVYDSDAVSAYPSCIAVANVSRATTKREIIDICGIDESVFRLQNINLLQGHVNALEYGSVMHGLPRPQDTLGYFDDL